MLVCPSIFDTVSIGTPFVRAIVVANVCLATCKLIFFSIPQVFATFFNRRLYVTISGTGSTFSDCWLFAYFSKINCGTFNSEILNSTSEKLLNLQSCQTENVRIGKPCETAKQENILCLFDFLAVNPHNNHSFHLLFTAC